MPSISQGLKLPDSKPELPSTLPPQYVPAGISELPSRSLRKAILPFVPGNAAWAGRLAAVAKPATRMIATAVRNRRRRRMCPSLRGTDRMIALGPRNTKLRHAGRPPMPLPALLKLPNPPAPQGADDRVRLPNKRRTAYDAALHFNGMLFTVGRPTLRIHPLPVPIPPLPGRRTVTLATPRRPAQFILLFKTKASSGNQSLQPVQRLCVGSPYPATTRASSSRVSLLRGFLGGGRWASVASSGTPPRGGGILKP